MYLLFFLRSITTLNSFYFLRSIGTLNTLNFLRSNTTQLSKSPDIYTTQNAYEYATEAILALDIHLILQVGCFS